MSEWKKIPKHYLGQSFTNTPFAGAKLIDSKTGKFTYWIGRQEMGLIVPSSLQQIPSGSYQAIMQFMDILDNAPQLLKKGKFKLTAKGQLPKALLDELGKDIINETTNGKVRTLQEIKDTMNSWGDKKSKSKSKSTYNRRK